MNRKKELERHYLRTFLRQSGLRYRIVGEPDPPDFLVHTGRELVGVEVTNLYKDEGPRGSPLKAAEQHNAEFIRALNQAYNAQGGQPLHVQALLWQKPDPATIPHLATRLRARRPARLLGRAEFETRVGRQRYAKFFLTALPDDEDRYRHWHCVSDSVGWARSITGEALEGTILKKAAKLGEYRKAVEQIMLLVVADRMKNSGMFRFEPTGALLDGHGFLEVHLFLYPETAHRVA